MIFPLKLIIILIAFLAFQNCENEKTVEQRDGLIIYQENQISWVRNFEPLNPVSICRWPTRGGIYETLFLGNPVTTEWIPWLATSYEWKNNNEKLIFTIRPNVKWSDGRPFSAHDVAYTFNLLKNYPTLDTRNMWEYLESVSVVSDSLVEVNFKRLYVPGFEALAGAYIVPKHIWSALEDPLNFSNENPVGTGPYTEVLRFNSQVWELGKNQNYWQPGKPHVEKLTFPTFSSNEQTTLALLSGKLDWGGAFIPAIQRIFVDKDPKHHHYWFRNTGHSTFLHTNTKDPILKDSNIRKAISYAINRDQVVRVGMYDYTTPAHVTSLSGPMSKWHSPEINEKENWTAFNLEKANDLLDNAGYEWKNKKSRVNKDGAPIEFDIIVVSGWSDWVRSAQVISQNLKKAIENLNAIRSNFTIFLDADGSYSFDDVKKIISGLEDGADVVSGSRFLGQKRRPKGMSVMHNFGNHFLSLISSIRNRRKISDLCTGLWGFSNDSISSISIQSKGFDLEAEIAGLVRRKKLTHVEVPVEWSQRKGGTSKLRSIRDGSIILLRIIMT